MRYKEGDVVIIPIFFFIEPSCFYLAPEVLFLLETTSEGGCLFKHPEPFGQKTRTHQKEGDVAIFVFCFSIEALSDSEVIV